MTDEHRQRLRPVEVNGHQEYGRYWFHGWCVVDGEQKALLEDERGHVFYRQPHLITFLDPEPVPR